MWGSHYLFVTRWTVPGTVEEVAGTIADISSLSRWWPSVYLDVQIVEPGDERGIGRTVELYTKGWLPYTLRWTFRVVENDYPYGFALEAIDGDFIGRGEWSFEPRGDEVEVTYRWEIRAKKPLIRFFSLVFRPLFRENHQWAMRRGEESLRLELARRRASHPADARLIPRPPGPTFPHSLRRLKRGPESLGQLFLMARRWIT